MEFALRQVGRNLVVSFVGRVNLEGEASLAFKERLKSLIADGANHVVVDLGQVGFLDSQGLGALISCLKVLRQAEGSFVLTNLSEPVEAVLRITRLIRVFDVQPTVEDALRVLGRAAPATAAAGRGA
jgi:anti-sigma B factor antagonist